MMKLKWKNNNSLGALTEDLLSNTVMQFLFQQFDILLYSICIKLLQMVRTVTNYSTIMLSSRKKEQERFSKFKYTSLF